MGNRDPRVALELLEMKIETREGGDWIGKLTRLDDDKRGKEWKKKSVSKEKHRDRKAGVRNAHLW